MKTIKKGDYVIYAAQQGELLQKALIGTKIFSPISSRIEVIKDILTANRKVNIGTFFRPEFKIYPVVIGMLVIIIEDGGSIEGFYKFNDVSPMTWITERIPERAELYRTIMNHDKLL